MRWIAGLLTVLAGCGGWRQTPANIIAFTGGVPTGAVMARDKGDALLTLGAAGAAGTSGGDMSETTGGATVHAAGIGIASADDLGWAARSRLELGMFGEDLVCGQISYELGPGYLRHGRYGGGLVGGWSYGGFFDSRHSLPVRALGYWRGARAVGFVSGHTSWRGSEGWTGRGLETGVMLDELMKMTFSARYEREGLADAFTVSVGWSIHTVGDDNVKP